MRKAETEKVRILRPTSLTGEPSLTAKDAALKLTILSTLRGVEKEVSEEVMKVMSLTREDLLALPLTADVMRATEAQAEARGEKNGIKKGELKLLTNQLEARFGPLPVWASKQLAAASSRKLERWSLQLLTAKTLKATLK